MASSGANGSVKSPGPYEYEKYIISQLDTERKRYDVTWESMIQTFIIPLLKKTTKNNSRDGNNETIWGCIEYIVRHPDLVSPDGPFFDPGILNGNDFKAVRGHIPINDTKYIFVVFGRLVSDFGACFKKNDLDGMVRHVRSIHALRELFIGDLPCMATLLYTNSRDGWNDFLIQKAPNVAPPGIASYGPGRDKFTLADVADIARSVFYSTNTAKNQMDFYHYKEKHQLAAELLGIVFDSQTPVDPDGTIWMNMLKDVCKLLDTDSGLEENPISVLPGARFVLFMVLRQQMTRGEAESFAALVRALCIVYKDEAHFLTRDWDGFFREFIASKSLAPNKNLDKLPTWAFAELPIFSTKHTPLGFFVSNGFINPKNATATRGAFFGIDFAKNPFYSTAAVVKAFDLRFKNVTAAKVSDKLYQAFVDPAFSFDIYTKESNNNPKEAFKTMVDRILLPLVRCLFVVPAVFSKMPRVIQQLPRSTPLETFKMSLSVLSGEIVTIRVTQDLVAATIRHLNHLKENIPSPWKDVIPDIISTIRSNPQRLLAEESLSQRTHRLGRYLANHARRAYDSAMAFSKTRKFIFVAGVTVIVSSVAANKYFGGISWVAASVKTGQAVAEWYKEGGVAMAANPITLSQSGLLLASKLIEQGTPDKQASSMANGLMNVAKTTINAARGVSTPVDVVQEIYTNVMNASGDPKIIEDAASKESELSGYVDIANQAMLASDAARVAANTMNSGSTLQNAAAAASSVLSDIPSAESLLNAAAKSAPAAASNATQACCPAVDLSSLQEALKGQTDTIVDALKNQTTTLVTAQQNSTDLIVAAIREGAKTAAEANSKGISATDIVVAGSSLFNLAVSLLQAPIVLKITQITLLAGSIGAVYHLARSTASKFTMQDATTVADDSLNKIFKDNPIIQNTPHLPEYIRSTVVDAANAGLRDAGKPPLDPRPTYTSGPQHVGPASGPRLMRIVAKNAAIAVKGVASGVSSTAKVAIDAASSVGAKFGGYVLDTFGPVRLNRQTTASLRSRQDGDDDY